MIYLYCGVYFVVGFLLAALTDAWLSKRAASRDYGEAPALAVYLFGTVGWPLVIPIVWVAVAATVLHRYFNGEYER